MIPSRDGAPRLPETLGAIASQEVEGPVQVVVVDDGSADGTGEIASGAEIPWGAVEVVRHPTPRGRAAACNAGIARARAPRMVVLDDDMTLRPGALEAHRRLESGRTGCAALGRIVLVPWEGRDGFARFLMREEARRERALLHHRGQVPFELCLTGHFSAPTATLRAVGGYDERITRYGFEDIELGWRLSRAGVSLVYLPEAESLHRAYMTDLDRYLRRHVETGMVARELAARHPDGELRRYLRVDPPGALGLGHDPAGLVALRAANRLLLRRGVRRALGSRAGLGLARSGLRWAERLGAERALHLGFHVLRDLHYFQGYFGERRPEDAA